MSDIYSGDPSIKTPVLISTIPYDLSLASFVTGTIAANGMYSLLWTVHPDKPQLSLYNVHFSVRFGTNSSGYEWPYGASIDPTKYRVSWHTDLIRTNYHNNKIYVPIVMRNDTASPVTFYCFFKTLTFATSVGTLS